MHKVLTGKLQRVIRDGNMSDKLKIFKILKPDMLKICCDPYGKYVANLFVTFSKSFFSNFSRYSRHWRFSHLILRQKHVRIIQKSIRRKILPKNHRIQIQGQET